MKYTTFPPRFDGTDGFPNPDSWITGGDLHAESVSEEDQRRSRAIERQQYAELYLSIYAAGHVRGCPCAIPEVRTGSMLTQCCCEEISNG